MFISKKNMKFILLIFMPIIGMCSQCIANLHKRMLKVLIV